MQCQSAVCSRNLRLPSGTAFGSYDQMTARGSKFEPRTWSLGVWFTPVGWYFLQVPVQAWHVPIARIPTPSSWHWYHTVWSHRVPAFIHGCILDSWKPKFESSVQLFIWAFCFGSLLYTTEASNVLANLPLFPPDPAPSVASAETHDQDDGPAKVSSDSESEDARAPTKPLSKGLAVAPRPKGKNHTLKQKVHNQWYFNHSSTKLYFCLSVVNWKFTTENSPLACRIAKSDSLSVCSLQAHSTYFMSSLEVQVPLFFCHVLRLSFQTNKSIAIVRGALLQHEVRAVQMAILIHMAYSRSFHSCHITPQLCTRAHRQILVTLKDILQAVNVAW